MRVVIIRCETASRADYWWRYTLKLIEQEDDISKVVMKKYPQRRIIFSQFDLYFLSRYEIDRYLKGRHDEYYLLSDITYEQVVKDFIKTKEI